MNDFQKSINRKEPSDYEQIKVNAIEKDKKEKEAPYTGPPTAPKPFLFAALVAQFKKFLETFSSKGSTAITLFDQQQMLEDVISFRELLQILSKEDQSHNPEFAQQLSELWHNFLDDCNSILSDESNPPEALVKLKSFVTVISHFPPGEDHTLGFYFTEYAGKEWIPFPFMEILQNLHAGYKENSTQSALSAWIDRLSDILNPSED